MGTFSGFLCILLVKHGDLLCMDTFSGFLSILLLKTR